jgi:hypothetical protein
MCSSTYIPHVVKLDLRAVNVVLDRIQERLRGIPALAESLGIHDLDHMLLKRLIMIRLAKIERSRPTVALTGQLVQDSSDLSLPGSTVSTDGWGLRT